jgi:hypothetical protein
MGDALNLIGPASDAQSRRKQKPVLPHRCALVVQPGRPGHAAAAEQIEPGRRHPPSVFGVLDFHECAEP